jgi:hypothetical protein
VAVAGLLLAAAFAQPTSWRAGVATSYVWGGTYDGPGLTAQATWAPNEWFALGPVVDVTHLSGPLKSDNGSPASFSFTSTIVAPLFEFRWPLPYVEPYGGIALGFIATTRQRPQNMQCTLSTGGIGGFLEAGARATIGNHTALGVRGSVRSPAFAVDCALVEGPADAHLELLFTAGAALELRW